MRVQIICVGGIKERYFSEAAAEYIKRISPYAAVEITELKEEKLPPNATRHEVAKALRAEAAAITRRLAPNSRKIALCVEGRRCSSEEFADIVSEWGGTALDFIIGSAYGLDESVKAGAALRLSLSALTFPHRLARIILLEQIYRAFTIKNNLPYHRSQ